MTNDQKPLIHRKSTRLIKYDYSLPGYYFITICSQDRQYLFGKIVNEKMKLNNIGKTIDGYWHKLPEKFNNILLDKHTVMPNHLHGIIVINDDVANNTVGAPPVGARTNNVHQRAGTRPAPTIGNIVGTFKSITTNQYIQNVKNNNWPPFNKRVWQRNYYEHVIRNEEELNKIRQYIIDNPNMWPKDKNNLENWTRRL